MRPQPSLIPLICRPSIAKSPGPSPIFARHLFCFRTLDSSVKVHRRACMDKNLKWGTGQSFAPKARHRHELQFADCVTGPVGRVILDSLAEWSIASN